MRAWYWIVAAAVGVWVFLFGRGKPGPSPEAERLHGELQDALQDGIDAQADADRAAVENWRDKDVDAIRAETEREADDLRSGGDAGFMDRANDHNRANGDDG